MFVKTMPANALFTEFFLTNNLFSKNLFTKYRLTKHLSNQMQKNAYFFPLIKVTALTLSFIATLIVTFITSFIVSLSTTTLAHADTIVLSAKQQQSLSLTLLASSKNQPSLTLVQDQRSLAALKKNDVVKIANLSPKIRFDSLYLSNAGVIKQLNIREQSNSALSLKESLAPFISKQITLTTHTNNASHSSTVTLLKVTDNVAVVKEKNIIRSIVLTDPQITITLPSLAADEISVSFVSNAKKNADNMSINYLTKGIESTSELFLELPANSDQRPVESLLKSQLTVTNRTGILLENSRISLLNARTPKTPYNTRQLLSTLNQPARNQQLTHLAEKITLEPNQTITTSLFSPYKVMAKTSYSYQTTLSAEQANNGPWLTNNKKNINPIFNITLLNNTQHRLPKQALLNVNRPKAQQLTRAVYRQNTTRNNTTFSIENLQDINIEQKQISTQKTFDGMIINMQFIITNRLKSAQSLSLTTLYKQRSKILSSSLPYVYSQPSASEWQIPVRGNSNNIFNLSVRLYNK